MIPLVQLAAPPLAVVLGVAYVGVGAATSLLLAKRWPAAAVTAIVAWPVLLPLLGQAPAGRGPLGADIDRALDALSATLADAGEAADDLAGLREALHRADARLAIVDRVLAEERGAQIEALVAARARAADEIGAVLASVVQLRVSVGLLALAGDVAPIRDQLRHLKARLGALDEVARVTQR